MPVEVKPAASAGPSRTAAPSPFANHPRAITSAPYWTVWANDCPQRASWWCWPSKGPFLFSALQPAAGSPTADLDVAVPEAAPAAGPVRRQGPVKPLPLGALG